MALPSSQMQYMLRKHNTSQHQMENQGSHHNATLYKIHEESPVPHHTNRTEVEEPVSTQQDKSKQTEVTPNPTPAFTQGKKQIPVINMEDFEVVDMNDKLNLLTSAINKINTTFHLKFEELTQTFQGM